MGRVCFVQHAPYETPAKILDYVKERGLSYSTFHLYRGDKLPPINEYDYFVIMGGPMGVYEEESYPFLKEEKEFLKRVVKKKKKVLGVCLGAQLLSEVLGGKVFPCKKKEVGWFRVYKTKNPSKYFYDFPESFWVFQWHGDTFTIPEGCIHTLYSENCQNQAFESEDGRIVALQFHLEVDEDTIKRWIKEGSLREDKNFFNGNFEELNKNLYKFLERFFEG